MKERNLIQYLIISLKGIAMGAADVVPGVSGGTIAFISGIYEELLSSISSVNLKSLQILRKQGIKPFWKAINGNFLAALLLGIFMSVISLAKLISWALENEPILVWSFFFGLVLASIIFVGKQISEWNFLVFLVLIFGAAIAYYITTLEPIITENSSQLFIFMAGAIAICAMILPGISGAFILVLLGAYKPVLDAIHEKDIKLLGILALGAIVGLLTFSKLLKWLFVRYRNLTLAILTGFIIGSLNKIWPWKEVISWRLNSQGEQVPFNEESILPNAFNGDPQLLMAIVLAIIGFSMIIILEKLSKS
jgi:putative membrane protein